LKKYIGSVRSAGKSIATLVGKLKALQSNVANLHTSGRAFNLKVVLCNSRKVLFS
jgi:hypothetical protein